MDRELNRRGLRFARPRAYIRVMDRDFWTKKLREAQAELDAARKRTEVIEAASKVMRAKEALKRLETERAEPKRRTSRASGPAVSSS